MKTTSSPLLLQFAIRGPRFAVALLCLMVALSLKGAPLKVVQVVSPDINCVFDPDCSLAPTDTIATFELPGMEGEAILQSRTFTGQAGAPAAGLHAYLYRVSLGDLTPLDPRDPENCVFSFTIDFGPPASMDFDSDGSADDQVFVITEGAIGDTAIVSAEQIGNLIEFRFTVDPPLCPPLSSFFFGLVSSHAPEEVTAMVVDQITGSEIGVGARAPAYAEGVTTISVHPESGMAGATFAASGKVAAGSDGVRILWNNGASIHSLATGTVDGEGNYALELTVPSNAVPAMVSVGALPLGSGGSDIAWASFEVLPLPPATVAGLVLDSDPGETPLVGVGVHLLDPSGLLVAQTETDGDGGFSFAGLVPGFYTVDVQVPKFPPSDAPAGPGANVDLVAKPALDIEIPPVYLTSVGAIAMPGGSYNATQPAKVGEPGGALFARLASIQGKGVPPVNVRFWVDLKPGSLLPGAPIIVVFQFFKGDNLVASQETLSKTQVAPGVPFNFPAFVADLNSIELPPGNLKLRITAISTGFAKLGSWEFQVHMADLGGRWYSSHVQNPSLVVSREDFFNLRYQFAGSLPSPSVNWNEPINLGLITLDNRLAFHIPIKERFHTTGAWSGEASVDAEVTFLDQTFIKELIPYQGPQGSDLPGSQYFLPTKHVDLTGKLCSPIPGLGVDAHKCFNLCIFGCKKCAGLKIGAFFCVQGFANLDSQIKPGLKVNAVAAPGIVVSVPIQFVFDVVVCSSSGAIEPSATASIPIYYDPDRSPVIGFDNPCLVLDATLHYKFKCFGKTFFSGSKGLGSKTFGCNSATLQDIRPLDHGESFEPFHLPQPDLASNQDGHAMAVWIPEPDELTPGHPGGTPAYSFFDGDAWSPAAEIHPGGGQGEEPRVVFLNASEALAVWVHAKVLPDNDELTEEDEGVFFSSFDILYSLWNGASWSEPVSVSDDDFYDGRPVLAADPATERALLVWLRHQDPIPEGHDFLALYHSFFQGGEWSPPERLDPESTALDFQPTARFDREGIPHVAWVRDADGDVMTPGDRTLVIAGFGRTEWSAPEVIPGLPPAPWTPSMDFDHDDQPVIAFVTPSVDEETGELLGADGNQSRLHVAVRGPDGWQGVPVGGDVFAERPVLRVNPENQPIIHFRRFGFEDVHEGGDLAAAIAEVGSGLGEWRTDYLTHDGLVNWQVAFEIDSSSGEHHLFWQKRQPGVAHSGGVNQRIRRPHGVDLTFARTPVSLSNPAPRRGELIDVIAHIKNTGFESLTDGSVVVQLFDQEPGPGIQPYAEQTLSLSLAFGGETDVIFRYPVSTAGARTLHIVLDATNEVTETDENNNTARAVLRNPPGPSGLFAFADPGHSGITLEWTPVPGEGSPTYAILRAPAGEDPVFEFVGSTTGNTWSDPLVEADTDYQYQVVVMEESSAPSDPALTGAVGLPAVQFPADFEGARLTATIFDERITLAWPARLGLMLEEAEALDGEGVQWRAVGAAPVQSSGIAQLTLPAVQNTRFFRLTAR